jgi:hypothetical protein
LKETILTREDHPYRGAARDRRRDPT